MPTTDTDNAQQFATQLLKLLSDYAGKLEQKTSELRRLRLEARSRNERFFGGPDWNGLNSQHNRITKALLNATRQASTLAEQGAIDEFSRVELQLRLAEVEGLLEAYQFLLNQQ